MSVAVYTDQSLELLQRLVTSGALGTDTPENRRAISLSISALEYDEAGTIGLEQFASVVRLHSTDLEHTVTIVEAFRMERSAPWCVALVDLLRSIPS